MRDVKNGGGGGTTRREEAERFIFGEERGETRGQFSCAVMLAKFAQLKRVEAEEEEEENCTRVENFTKFAAKLCSYVYIYISKREMVLLVIFLFFFFPPLVDRFNEPY